MPKKGSKTYYPPKTFDDDLAGLVKLATDSKWAFTNVDFKQLAKDVIEQRTQRGEHDAAEVQFDHLHETFGMQQEARHARFSAAMSAARGAFKDDKAVLAQLAKFKRSARRAKKAATPVLAMPVAKAA